ncbi:unnamed protein product [Protopolystoma xenopodis]|uniref:Uncharacterized protein n=1 Tax=Protopolystoma xenopodis TaxID=117903 RepID=A0A3S5BRU3_9PLAT|nr:unnamed protein product [Protopolystoma xenopodis]
MLGPCRSTPTWDVDKTYARSKQQSTLDWKARATFMAKPVYSETSVSDPNRFGDFIHHAKSVTPPQAVHKDSSNRVFCLLDSLQPLES